MKTTIGRCHHDELSALTALLDNEFVYAKKRHMSLGERYPGVLCKSNLKNIYVSRQKRSIVASIVVKPFHWLVNGRGWRGVMLGMVYTKPEIRGQGVASQLMQHIQEDWAKADTDFAVLWTGQPEFYRRLGWFSQDQGVLGQAKGQNLSSLHLIKPKPVTNANFSWLEMVRSKWVPERAIRSVQDYQVIPLPAESLEMFMVDQTGSEQGYALVGRLDDTGYVYELVGDHQALNLLWQSLVNHYQQIYINDHQPSISSSWLSANADIVWIPQCLAMWHPLSEEIKNVLIGQWYIHYLDRI